MIKKGYDEMKLFPSVGIEIEKRENLVHKQCDSKLKIDRARNK